MKLVLKIFAALCALAILLVAGGVAYLKVGFPDVGPAPNLTVAATDAQIERGKYLANHVTICIDCHAIRDWNIYAAPPKAGTAGKGGEVFPKEMGFPGTLISPNITPAALGDWTDGEIARAIVSGVNKDGDALFPLMPYPSYAHLTQEDLEAIIAYVRTLKPIDHTPPRSALTFPMNLITRTIPKPYTAPASAPDRSDSVAYGKYLTTISACADCHTPKDHGQPISGMEMAGGTAFPLPSGKTVRTANITPDQATGIGNWDRRFFIGYFKRFDTPEARQLPVEDGVNTLMPWTMYAGMTGEDLGAIYDYLRTLPPVNNRVEKFPENN